jgi:alkylation response protein AidB-like acyl-CoA dehydrogenase
VPAERNLPTPEAEEIVGLARSVAREQLAPRVAAAEEDAAFPREVFRTLGELGFLGMPYPEEAGGAGQPYEVYLQALEEISAVWASVGVGLSVHMMSCYPLAGFGTREQKERWLPEMTAGDLLGGYCLSEAEAGSDPAAMRTGAVREGDAASAPGGGGDAPGYRVTGSKAWVTHGGEADFYTLFARTSEERSRGISCFLVPGDAPGLTARVP